MRRRHPPARVATIVLVTSTALLALSGCGAAPVLPPASVVTVPPTTDLGTVVVTVAAAEDSAIDGTDGTDGTADSTAVTLSPSGSADGTTDATTGVTASAAAEGEWVDVTGNLVGIASECGNVSLVASSPVEPTTVAVIAAKGAYSLTEGADAWVPLGTGAASATLTNRGQTIVFDPTAPLTFWEAGAYNGAGVYRTDDGGVTFRQLGTLEHVEGLAVDLADPQRQTLLAALHESPKLYRSTDGGASWTEISQTLPKTVGFLSGPAILGPNEYMVGSRSDTGSGVFLTSDGGVTWRQVYQGGSVIGFPVTPAADGVTFWAVQNGGIIASSDRETWTMIADGTVTSAVPINLVGLGDGRIATLGLNDHIVASADRGRTWKFVGPALPFAPNGMTYSPVENAIYAWRFDCNFAGTNVINANSIVRFDLDG